MSEKKVIIIGAGLAGLATGIYARMTLAHDLIAFVTSGHQLDLEPGEELIDEVGYDTSAAGVSFSLDPSCVESVCNDDFAGNWCAAPLDHPPFTGTGSPGASNDPCP